MNVTPIQLERSLGQAFAVFGKDPRYQVVRDLDHLRTYSGLNEAFLNNVFETRDSGTLNSERIREISNSFQGNSFIWRLGPTTSNLEDTAQRLIDFGLVYVGTSPGMLFTGRTEGAPGGQGPKGYSIEKVTDATLELWFQVWAEGFGISDGARAYVLDLFRAQGFARDPAFALFLGRAEGRAVCCGSTYDDGICTGLYNITTLEAERQKGYASALSLRCVEAAKLKSKRPIYLYSSPQGFSLYEKVGFEAVVEMEQFALVQG